MSATCFKGQQASTDWYNTSLMTPADTIEWRVIRYWHLPAGSHKNTGSCPLTRPQVYWKNKNKENVTTYQPLTMPSRYLFPGGLRPIHTLIHRTLTTLTWQPGGPMTCMWPQPLSGCSMQQLLLNKGKAPKMLGPTLFNTIRLTLTKEWSTSISCFIHYYVSYQNYIVLIGKTICLQKLL